MLRIRHHDLFMGLLFALLLLLGAKPLIASQSGGQSVGREAANPTPAWPFPTPSVSLPTPTLLPFPTPSPGSEEPQPDPRPPPGA